MKKEFGKWHTQKEQLEGTPGTALFHAREVWWCALGTNLGFEQDGRGASFTRPVVILTKFNLDACLVVPLTAKPKTGKYYFPVGKIGDREAVAVLSQLRFVDRKRFEEKITTLELATFNSLVKAILGVCFPGLK